MVSCVAVLLSVGLVGCDKGPDVVTSIEFDGKTRSFTTKKAVCTRQPDGGLVILVSDGPKRSVRLQLTERGRLVVQKAGLRHDDLAGYVEDPHEVTATRVDDTFTFSGRMPPNPGDSQWHTFKIETSCPGYQDLVPTQPGNPPLGVP
jgi:hypothetical protein